MIIRATAQRHDRMFIRVLKRKCAIGSVSCREPFCRSGVVSSKVYLRSRGALSVMDAAPPEVVLGGHGHVGILVLAQLFQGLLGCVQAVCE